MRHTKGRSRKDRKYKQSVKGKEADRKFKESPKGREVQYRYRQTQGYREAQARYRKTNKGKERSRRGRQIRRAHEAGVMADFTQEQWEEMLVGFENKCAYCRKEFPPGELEQDHIVPVSRGGAYTKTNVFPACAICNQSKGSKLDWHTERRTKEVHNVPY